MSNGGIVDSFITVELTCADIPGLLRTLNGSGISLFGIEQMDTLTVLVRVMRRDVILLQHLAARSGATMTIITVTGPVYLLKRAFKRPLLIFGLLLLFVLVMWLPTRVLFITVEGNQNLHVNRIIEEAGKCGIVFGASRRDVRSEKMKNALLAAIPELQWAGINTSGCAAIISVKERATEEYTKMRADVSSVVAVRDGIIESCISSKGSLQCRLGQAVKAGDVLISGYTDCGIKTTAESAQGEIFAKTVHEITVITPTDYIQKGSVIQMKRNYSLLLGKKRINFYKCSGISGSTCDKIYSEYYVSLPGGFQLPLGFAVTEIIVYDKSTAQVSALDNEAVVQDYAQAYLFSQMISGKILRNTTSVEHRENVLVLHGRYLCSEMIGRTKAEGILEKYGKDH